MQVGATPARVRWLCELAGLVLGLIYLLGLGWFAGMQAFNSIQIVEMSGRAWNFPMPMVIRTAFFLGSRCVEIAATEDLFTGTVKDQRTRDYVEGRYG